LIDTPTASLSPLSLHDALPISEGRFVDRVGDGDRAAVPAVAAVDLDVAGLDLAAAVVLAEVQHAPAQGGGLLHREFRRDRRERGDRKSTRLNSSHVKSSYAVFC